MIDDCAHLQKAPRLMGQCVGVPATELVEKRVSTDYAQDGTPSASQSKILDSIASKAKAQERSGGRIELNSIDLNNVYDDSHDSIENLERSHVPANPGIGSCGYPLLVQNDSHKSSPPQISGNSDSASGQSLSSSCGEVQSRTDRIVFKLFEKDPNDFPLVLRTKILDWLSHSPTDIESYIRPGCIILTIYLRMGKPMWEELCRDLGSSLSRLLDVSSDNFWRTGWVYARVQHHVSFICDGQVVLDTPLPLKNLNNCRILSIKPIAVPVYERAQFVVKCFNLAWSTTRLLCALEGKYLVQETCYDLMEAADAFAEHDEIQCLSFPCSIPNVTGRGFIEVEDNGLSSSFFPFIVAEQDVCSEICTLEGVIEVETTNDKKEENEMTEAKNQALDFINEMGWLLHRSYLRSRLGNKDPNLNLFSFNRFKWLMEFSMDRDWCAVVEKLLGVIFNGTVDLGEHPSIELALLELGLLHRAVRRNCRPMVELLLMYLPYQGLDKPGFEQKQQVDSSLNSFIFKPDVIGPGGLTPLHTAAGRDGSDDVLDALTDDPGMVGIEAWNKARDSTGLTPNDYACLQGRPSYIHLVQKKINKKLQSGHVVVDIPSALPGCNSKQKASDGPKMGKAAGFVTEKIKTKGMLQHPQCQFCKQKLAYGKLRPSLAYRPAMLSMVAIAAVCVCVALLFKTLPEVQYASPFRWELLKYGSS
ncbi:squamosa promoter-binding-like protein 1 isoform X2 [Malania oleifera]|nr:squamosa promoter-binding-like protein 1 isoform X2 [Malania oleifera]XP_057958992.1 squamosa promoter-binding-like protein 1 isoform X2 [Malania oleifera]